MSESAPSPEKKTLIQRVTHLFSGAAQHTDAPVAPAKPAESDEKREERLAAYRKMCAEAEQSEAANGEVSHEKQMKYRSDSRK